MLSVTSVKLLINAVTPIIKSNSSCIGVPALLKLTLVSAYLFTLPYIGTMFHPAINLSTDL